MLSSAKYHSTLRHYQWISLDFSYPDEEDKSPKPETVPLVTPENTSHLPHPQLLHLYLRLSGISFHNIITLLHYLFIISLLWKLEQLWIPLKCLPYTRHINAPCILPFTDGPTGRTSVITTPFNEILYRSRLFLSRKWIACFSSADTDSDHSPPHLLRLLLH